LKSGKIKESFNQKGIFIIPGKVLRGDHKGQYLIVIDIDREKGIKEFLKIFENNRTVEDFSKKNMLVQHRDEKNKAHFYFYPTIPFERKSSDNILGIEVKTNRNFSIIKCVIQTVNWSLFSSIEQIRVYRTWTFHEFWIGTSKHLFDFSNE
jgi:hypothetical protein